MGYGPHMRIGRLTRGVLNENVDKIMKRIRSGEVTMDWALDGREREIRHLLDVPPGRRRKWDTLRLVYLRAEISTIMFLCYLDKLNGVEEDEVE